MPVNFLSQITDHSYNGFGHKFLTAILILVIIRIVNGDIRIQHR